MILLLLAMIAVAALTWLIGWWGVLLAAVAAGAATHSRRGSAWRIALGAALAWALLLLLDARAGALGTLSRALAGVIGVPALVLVLSTLAFPAVLAWSAATLAIAVRRQWSRYVGARSSAREASA
jgi:hypothetical protein